MVIPLYHPAAILYNRSLEAELHADLEALVALLGDQSALEGLDSLHDVGVGGEELGEPVGACYPPGSDVGHELLVAAPEAGATELGGTFCGAVGGRR